VHVVIMEGKLAVAFLFLSSYIFLPFTETFHLLLKKYDLTKNEGKFSLFPSRSPKGKPSISFQCLQNKHISNCRFSNLFVIYPDFFNTRRKYCTNTENDLRNAQRSTWLAGNTKTAHSLFKKLKSPSTPYRGNVTDPCNH